ncbi:DUF551 domain-containing protein [Salmonella enterica]|nr:DUF551 domain-containing protein [Salmonella enterica subsp. enterica serovar Carmel]ECA2175720.1 DUF551 domain-containing protein [Salmonella enterica subsp. enterica serovar Kisangani]EDE7123006.1 DUF551 domain-containing protein [Salmonella enterica subsp. enterica serovar Hvittingfoss]EDH3337219.1 DUF551 domain-containing protein [Salmonella enterica]EDY1890987.1 DUF551 domain-containing protein [Salmonella enterica]
MTTITRENAEIKSFITGFLSDPAHDNQSSDSLLANVFRIALASLEAEPVAWKVAFTRIDNEFDTFTVTYSDKAEVEQYVRLYETCGLRADITPLYTAQPAPVAPDGWISCSERMPEKNQNVLISVNFDSSLVEPLICSARYTGSTFRRGDATIKPGNGIEQATHWMKLPEPPLEAN